MITEAEALAYLDAKAKVMLEMQARLPWSNRISRVVRARLGPYRVIQPEIFGAWMQAKQKQIPFGNDKKKNDDKNNDN